MKQTSPGKNSEGIVLLRKKKKKKRPPRNICYWERPGGNIGKKMNPVEGEVITALLGHDSSGVKYIK